MSLSFFTRPLRWPHRIALALAAVFLLLVYIAVIGVRIDAAALRPMVASILTDKLGRPIHLDGVVQLEVSLHPALLVRQVSVAQASGFGVGEFLQVGEMRMALNLLPLLQNRLRADALSGQDVKLLLMQHADGSNNWTFKSNASVPAADTTDNTPVDLTQAARIDIRNIALTGVNVEYRGVNGKPQYFALDKLDAAIPADGPMHLYAEGRVEQTLPYKLAAEGGSLAALAAGKAPWPVSLKLDFLGSSLVGVGSLESGHSTLRFGLGTPDLAKLGRLLGMRLPDAGAAGLGALLRVEPGVIRLTNLSGVLGKTSLSGDLAIDLRGERPKLAGSLALPTLDLRPFLGQKDDADEPPASLRELYKSLAQARFDLAALNEYDIDVGLKVEQWLSLPGAIHDAALQLKLERGKLSLPLQATVAGVPLQGGVFADATKPVPSFRITFGAEHADIGGLAQLLTGAQGIQGKLGHLKLQLDSSGKHGQALMEALAVKLELAGSRLSYGNVAGGKPVAFTFDKFDLALPANQPLKGTLKGSLLGKPLEAELFGGALAASMASGKSPIEFIAHSQGVLARVSGSFGSDILADLVFSVGAAKSGEVAAWFGLKPDATVPLALAGHVSLKANDWHLSNLVFQLGQSVVYADIDSKANTRRAMLRARVDITRIDSVELDSLRPVAIKTDKASDGPVLDIPILPQQIILSDADISVHVAAVEGAKLAVRDVRFDGRIRDGFMQLSPFHANLADTNFEGALMLDLRNQLPRIQLWLSAADVNAGSILQQLNLVQTLDARLAHLGLYLDSSSSKLSGLIANASLSGQIDGGQLVLRDANTGAAASILVSQGALKASPGERVKLDVAGTIDALPVTIAIRSAPAKDLVNPALRVPFEITVEAAQSRLSLSGSLARDIAERDVELAMHISGQRFDALNKLLRVSLPPWGPWSAAGQFRMSRRGYEVNQLKLQVGSSELNGRGLLDTRGQRARLEVALAAPLIQLEDFRTGSWSATDSKAAPAAVTDVDTLRKQASLASDQVQGLLSPALLQQLNANMTVEVERVLSGRDQLGSGSLQARLENGQAEIGPVKIAMPGGSAQGSLSYVPGERDVQAGLKLDVDNFDYGVLARRIKPESDMGGRFSVHVDVHSRAERLSEILRHGNGQINFAVWPQNLKADVFDMWAVNVLVALLPTLDPNNVSKVNCAVGRFALDNGKLNQQQLVIDTSQMRVTGKSSVSFVDETLQLRLQPQAKSAQFLSLAIPIEVSGTFKQFSVGPNPGDILATVIRMATSIFWVPVKKLFEDKVPVDGSDVCALR
jgi:uncharacterized protein involved in outer membrane biogenesis